MRLVFNTESDEPQLLGEFYVADEDTIHYIDTDRRVRRVNEDCCATVTINIRHLPNYRGPKDAIASDEDEANATSWLRLTDSQLDARELTRNMADDFAVSIAGRPFVDAWIAENRNV